MAGGDLITIAREFGFPATLALLLLYFVLNTWKDYKEENDRLLQMAYQQNEQIVAAMREQARVLAEIVTQLREQAAVIEQLTNEIRGKNESPGR